jgi:hypothetical protein
VKKELLVDLSPARHGDEPPARRRLPLVLRAVVGMTLATGIAAASTQPATAAPAHAESGVAAGVAAHDPARTLGRTASSAQVPRGCRQPADHRFRPTSLSIRTVVASTRVLARGHDRRGVPKPPPLTNRGKWQFAWDKTVRAGAGHGVVRLTAHTYPAFAGKALGNRLLDRLGKKAVLVVRGPQGERLCYRVTRRMSVPASRSVPAYYDSSGPARLAILVCSGVRRGPGDWSRRTIWFAAPIAAAAGTAR